MTVKIKMNRRWFGNLTYENIDEVARVLTELLSEGKFTWIRLRRKSIDDRLEVYPSMMLNAADSRTGKAVNVSECRDDKTGELYSKMITIHTSYGLHFLRTSIEKGWNDDRKAADYLNFVGDRVTVEGCAPCGDLIESVFVLENRYEEKCLAESTWAYLEGRDGPNADKLLQDLTDNLTYAGYPNPKGK